MMKITRARYTLEFKQEAERRVEGGQSQASVARTLGLVEQTRFNGVKANLEGRLNGADSKPVSAEQMEIARLRAELARVKMERDILGKGESAGRASSEWPARRTRTSPRMRSEVRLHPASSPGVADHGAVSGTERERQRLQTLMREHGIRAKGKKRFKITTNSNHDLPIAQNLLDRQFTVAKPDRVWVGDITYCSVQQIDGIIIWD